MNETFLISSIIAALVTFCVGIWIWIGVETLKHWWKGEKDE